MTDVQIQSVRVLPGGDVVIPADLFEQIGRPERVVVETPISDHHIVIRDAERAAGGKTFKAMSGRSLPAAFRTGRRIGCGGRIYGMGRVTNGRCDVPVLIRDGALVIDISSLPKRGAL